jgi:hypothetical protein
MTATNDGTKPLSRRTINRVVKTRSATTDNLAQITKSIFIAGAEEAPRVSTQIIPIERMVDGKKSLHYEVRLEVDGVRLGEHASPPPMRGEAIKKRFRQEELLQYDKLLAPFAPDHLSVDLRPRRLLKPFKRIPERLDRKTRYNTTIFSPDERRVFQDTTYPWSAFGRCETNFGPFSGV